MLVEKSYQYKQVDDTYSTIWIETNSIFITSIALETDRPIIVVDFAGKDSPNFSCYSCKNKTEAILIKAFTQEFFGRDLTDLCKLSYMSNRNIPLGNYRYFATGKANYYLMKETPTDTINIEDLS